MHTSSHQFILFRHSPERLKVLYYVWNWSFIILSAAAVSALSLLLAIGHYDWGVFWGYFRYPVIFALNTLPILLVELFLFLIIGRAWIAYSATAAFFLAASIGNYFKLICRDDPFIFDDLNLIGMALEFAGKYEVSPDKRIAFCLGSAVLMGVFLALFVRFRPKRRAVRFIAAALCLAALVPAYKLCTGGLYNSEKTDNFSVTNRLSSTQNYISHGFVYPFIHSIASAFPEKPRGYSDAIAEELLSAFEDGKIAPERRANIIAIQLEAYSDLEEAGFSSIAPEVYAPLRRICAESLSGRLVTNIFAGGTVDTERSFATGYSSQIDYRHATESYIRYLRGQGYYAEGSHSCYDWFYNRKNVNEYLGFENYWFFENRYGVMADGNIARDNVLIPDILSLYKERDRSKPYVNMSVTYQGHGPYPTEWLNFGDGYWTDDSVTHDSYYILNNYLAAIQNTGENLLKLIDGLRDDDEPVILVVFGDHKPWLGNSNSVYEEMGINIDTTTDEGFYNYYATPYFIWANGAARERFGDVFTGEGPDISPCFLMNLVFERCSWQGSRFMQLASKAMRRVPVINTNGFYLEEGRIVSELSEEGERLVNDMKTAEYYLKKKVYKDK